MTDAELRARMKACALGWKETGEILEAERREKVRQTDTARSLRNLGPPYNSAIYLDPPAPSSGLVEFYEILARSR